jgi:hypothetical protein
MIKQTKIKAPKQPKRLVLYRGPSLLDGAPIVVVAIVSNRNRKTGPMIQTYIQRSDVTPVTASRLGLDASNCGACSLRGRARPDATRGQSAERECYVLLGQGPTGIHKGLAKGIYPEAQDAAHIAALGRGRLVRIGTYGDGAAAPAWIWQALLSEAKAHTAYSHQFDVDGASADAALYMQSAGSEAEARAAWAKGRRTFRVIQSLDQIVKGSEIVCPASKEAGARVQCAECRLCGGANVKGKSIAIVDHGPLARARAKRRFTLSRNGAAIAA